MSSWRIYSGFFYIVVISVLFLFLLTLLKSVRKKIKKISAIFFVLIISLMLTSFQSLSTYQLFLNSTKGSYSLSQISNLLFTALLFNYFFLFGFFWKSKYKKLLAGWNPISKDNVYRSCFFPCLFLCG